MKFVLIFFLFCVTVILPQKLEGVVYENISNNKIALPGVNIYWAGTTIGTTTDENGKFAILKLSKDSSKLIVAYVSYKPDTLLVNKSEKYIEISLTENRELNEITINARTKGTEFDDLSGLFTQNILRKELKKAACCNLSESFETNASVDVSFSDAVTGSKQIKMLGLAGKYSQLMTENIPNLRGSASAFGLYYIPGPWMESIQISKGTASVMNGYESTTGQINIQFKNANNFDKYYADIFSTSNLKNDINMITNQKISNELSTILFMHGEYFANKVDHNNDSFLDHPNVRQLNILNKWVYDDYENWHIEGTLNYILEDRIGGQIGFNNQNDLTKYRSIIKTNRLQFWSKVGYIFESSISSLGFINMLTKHNQEYEFGIKDYNSNEFSYYSNLIFESEIFNSNHKINTGISLVYDDFNELFSDKKILKNEFTPGAFFQYTFQPIENLTLIGGIRGDNSSIHGFFITPRFHLRYSPIANSTFRFSIGKGYRSVNIIPENISLLSSSREFLIDKDLDLEEAVNYGVNFTQYFYLFDRELTLNAEFYRTDFLNKIVVDIDHDYREVNFYNLNGNSYANNFQVELNYELIPRLDFLGAIRFTDVKTTIDDQLMEEPLNKNFKGIVSFSYLTKLRLWQFDLTSQFNGKSRIPKYFGKNYNSYSPAFVNIMVQITRYFKDWEIFAGIENLTNFIQDKSVISADDPFGPNYDSSIIWGPLEGRKLYAGIRLSIK